MNLKYLIFCSFLLFMSCSGRPDLLNKNSISKEEIHINDQEHLSGSPELQTYRLWHTIDQFDLNRFKYFGEFYNDRLKFYYLQNPQLHIGTAKVNLIVLYFIDDRLVKIRYHLDRNIEAHLMDSLGIGLLATRYNLNKRVLATERSLMKLKEFNLSRNDPDVYKINWDRSIISSTYLVNGYSDIKFQFDTITAEYIYIDELKSYKKRLTEIENSRLAKINIDTIKTKNNF